MSTHLITANPSQIIVEQLAASGVSYVFYNSGSREARFFDALHENPKINGILALHEGSVTAMAGGYAQAKCDPAVMVVHLGAGLAQCLGQLINVWTGSLPVVVITFVGDTGSFADRIGLDLSHSYGPTSISAPFTKASWTVIEPEGLPEAIQRAICVAKTPPVGPVHLAIYDRLLGTQQVQANIIDGGITELRSGYPSDSDVEALALALHKSERPLIYVGDGVWKSGAEARLVAIAEHFGAIVSSTPEDLRGMPITHPLHSGRFEEAARAIDPDCIVCVGVRHGGSGSLQDYSPFAGASRVIGLGPDVANLKGLPGIDLAILADERRTLERLEQMVASEPAADKYKERRRWARSQASALRSQRRNRISSVSQKRCVGPLALLDAIDIALERIGGGLVTTEQFAIPLDCVPEREAGGTNIYIRPAGGSEGYGIGAPCGVKLACPEKPVVGLVGDGSMYYADSGLWTAVHHRIPVLYMIANNQSYGVVADFFGEAEGSMKSTGEYAGVVLDGIDPVRIAEGFGMEAVRLEDEAMVGDYINHGLEIVERERRPYLLDVRMPLGLPRHGRASIPFRLADARP